MARPRKTGLDYFPHDVDASGDEKLEPLEALFSNDGYAVYFKLLERIYRDGGSLDMSKPDIMITLAKKCNLAHDFARFEKIFDKCLSLELFNSKIFVQKKLLTSTGIKKRVKAVSAKRLKNRTKKVGVSEAETQQKRGVSEAIRGERKEKKSKVKEIKEKREEGDCKGEVVFHEPEAPYGQPSASPPSSQESETPKGEPPEKKAYGEFGNVKLTEEEHEKLVLLFGEKVAGNFIESLSAHLASTGKRYKSHYATIRNWLRRDKIEPFKLCTKGNAMPQDAQDKNRWKHTEAKEVTKPDKKIKGKKCVHCGTVFDVVAL